MHPTASSSSPMVVSSAWARQLANSGKKQGGIWSVFFEQQALIVEPRVAMNPVQADEFAALDTTTPKVWPDGNLVVDPQGSERGDVEAGFAAAVLLHQEQGRYRLQFVISPEYAKDPFTAIQFGMLGRQIASIHNLGFYLWLVREARKHILAGDYSSWKNKMVRQMDQRL